MRLHGGGSRQEYITVLGAGSASGASFIIVYKYKHLYNTWYQGEPAGAPNFS